jgi:hypothetical protein
MAKKKGKDDEMREEERAPPLPLEAEEGAVQLKWGQYAALAFGVVFLVITLVMIVELLPVLQISPGLQYPELPLLAVGFFAIGAASDLAVAVTARPGAIALWREGKFVESDKFLLGWRAWLSVVAGGVIPGFFLFRASDRLQPLVEMQRGGMPPPGVMPGAPMGPGAGAPPPMMGAPGYGAPPMSPPPAYSPYGGAPPRGGPADDSVAPDPFGGGGSRTSAPPSGSPWSRPPASQNRQGPGGPTN